MANFKQSIMLTLNHEGGLQKNPNDHANWSSGQIGVGTLIGTKYGITPADVPGVNIENLTVDQAVEYYHANYWKDLYSQINDQAIADKLFDAGVLMGVKTAVKMLQISISNTVSIVPDGVFGLITLAQVNEHATLDAYKTTLINHAIAIVSTHPEEATFVHGWINRIQS